MNRKTRTRAHKVTSVPVLGLLGGARNDLLGLDKHNLKMRGVALVGWRAE